MEPKTNNFAPFTDPQFQAQGQAQSAGASTINFPDGMEEGNVVAYCAARNRVWDAWYPQIQERIETAHKIFRNQPTQGTKGTKSIPIPTGYGIIEAINARMAANILGKPKAVDAIPRVVQPDNANTKRMEDFINQQVLSKTRPAHKGKAAIKGSIIEGVMFWRNVWCQKEDGYYEPTYTPHPATGQPVFTGNEEVSYQRSEWDWEYKNPANLAFDPHCITRIQDSSWVRERAKMSYNELLQWQTEGRIEGVERLKDIIPASIGSGPQREDWESKLKKAEGDKEWNFTYADEKEYLIEEWWATITYGQGQVMKAKWFLAEGKFVLSFGENPLRPMRVPYGSCPFSIDPRSVYGVSAVGSVKNIQEQLNAYSSKQDTLIDRSSNPLILYDDSSGLTGRTTFMRMTGLQAVTNVNGLKEFTIDSSAVGIVQAYMDFLISMEREASGANEQFQGTAGADTATEFAGLQAAAGSRFADVADTINQGFIEELAKECYLHYRQYGIDGQMIATDGTQDGISFSLTRADFATDFQFQVISASTEAYKAKQIADDTAFVGQMVSANSNPAVMGGKLYNIPEHIRNISLPLRGQKNSADMFIDAPVPPMPGMQAGPAGAMPPPPGGPPMMPPPQEMPTNG